MTTNFTVKLAETEAERAAAFRLRYDVFVRELGGGGDLVDHDTRQERDRFDAYFDHMILTDNNTKTVVGVYRLLRGDAAARAGQFYSEDEFDLSPLTISGRKLLELGRSCLHADYRGGSALMHLWGGVADYIKRHQIEILFGVASFHGTSVGTLAPSLSLLHHRHLAPEELRVKVLPTQGTKMDLIAEDQIDRRRAMANVPSLIKAYLRLGGFVGEGAFVDHAFNTTDVCLILDTARMNARHSRIYTEGRS